MLLTPERRTFYSELRPCWQLGRTVVECEGKNMVMIYPESQLLFFFMTCTHPMQKPMRYWRSITSLPLGGSKGAKER